MCYKKKYKKRIWTAPAAKGLTLVTICQDIHVNLEIACAKILTTIQIKKRILGICVGSETLLKMYLTQYTSDVIRYRTTQIHCYIMTVFEDDHTISLSVMAS